MTTQLSEQELNDLMGRAAERVKNKNDGSIDTVLIASMYDAIDRLTAPHAQEATGEPVAWRWHWLHGDEPDVWAYSETEKVSDSHIHAEPLYLTPTASPAAAQAGEIERLARVLCEAEGLSWEAQRSALTSGSGGDDEQEHYRHLASAAIAALRSPAPVEGLRDALEAAMTEKASDDWSGGALAISVEDAVIVAMRMLASTPAPSSTATVELMDSRAPGDMPSPQEYREASDADAGRA